MEKLDTDNLIWAEKSKPVYDFLSITLHKLCLSHHNFCLLQDKDAESVTYELFYKPEHAKFNQLSKVCFSRSFLHVSFLPKEFIRTCIYDQKFHNTLCCYTHTPLLVLDLN